MANKISEIYNISEQVYEGTIRRKEGIERALHKGINPNSMGDCIYVYRHLRNGNKFTRTLSADSFDYFLNNISIDYRDEGLLKALNALKKHIDYYEHERRNRVTIHKVRAIYEKYRSHITIESETDEEEQVEIIKEIKRQNKSKQELLNELQNTQETEPLRVEYSGKSYKRENSNIAKIKILRGTKCEICTKSILKKNGTEYIEAAHITPKSKKGGETLDNILLLCPNHHKEFDLGKTEIINRTKLSVTFSLNGIEKTIKLEPDL
jgi:5-methylcytosine-specific restriction protein A